TDRRHIVRVPVDRLAMEVMTPGDGLEWTPIITGDGDFLAYISATPQRPPLPAIMDLKDRDIRILARDRIPDSFPSDNLVIPEQVVFKAPDGIRIHGTLFSPPDSKGKKPAIVYVHGGPPRQMLLGWHYSSYYSNAYAVNQYLASRGFSVLSVNFRLGIGYGYEFHHPADGGTRGASEYQDIKSAGEWLASQEYVDAGKIGIYGGSYGGYLTAMALGLNSDIFAAGVDIHGVHDRTENRVRSWILPDQYERAPDAELAAEVAWKSSPVSSVDTWTSPVLIIHADDDRNVAFSQSTDLVKRLEKKGIPFETLVIVDDTHHFMMHKNQVKVNNAVTDFLIRYLK
ncbi:MAG: S9 family peptidase, partial [Bacteroidales bacterium]